MHSTTRRIAHETWQRASDAIVNGETEGAEFIVWWERLAGLNQGMQGPQTWKRLKEITAKMVGGKEAEEGRDDFVLSAEMLSQASAPVIRRRGIVTRSIGRRRRVRTSGNASRFRQPGSSA
jgi:hypothetical protein